MKARVIAMYLPQFHPFKENDEWWGKGFTEWTNVGKAKPLFRGHYQPRIPADLGYYDLRLPVVREEQAQLAREAGIEGFMYWHYWFGNGKTLMPEIFDEVLKSGKPDFPFCLGWGNHDWSRRTWNSSAQTHKDMMLMKQEYPGDEDIKAHFYNVLPAFKDPRYITVDGKPIFVIYDPFTLRDATHYMSMWRELAVENSLKGVHFAALVGGWAKNCQKALDLGFDAVIPQNRWYAEYKVQGYFWRMLTIKWNQKFPRFAPLNKFKYKHIIKYLFNENDKLENGYPVLLPNFDRTPRGGRRAEIFYGSTPELFKKHILQGLEYIKDKQPEHRIMFLQSWNEWAEGNYMEPDLKFGHGYLNALHDCIMEE